MRPKVKFYLRIAAGVVALFFYCEFIIYYVVLNQCDWPTLNSKNEDTSIGHTNKEPVRVMVLADIHLLGSRNGHWFDRLRREWQMYKTFQTAITLFKPELVFVLGDLLDEGSLCSNIEFQGYVDRFYKLFTVPKGTRMYVVVGNHDIGFHYRISPYLNERFYHGFKSPPIQMISVRGNHFVLVNSMALEGDGCFLCKPAEMELARISKKLQCAKGTSNGKCDSNRNLVYSRPILMQHYPLYRESDAQCNDFDSAPQIIKEERFRERWECLSKDASSQLLTQIEPRLVLSGHTHHGCTRLLSTLDGIEITLPSFSWRNKNNPNFGLGVFTPNNYAFSKCEMPKETTVIFVYILGILLLTVWIVYTIRRKRGAFDYKLH